MVRVGLTWGISRYKFGRRYVSFKQATVLTKHNGGHVLALSPSSSYARTLATKLPNGALLN